ncbi:hypothetical protein [Corynebacterium coyleae]|uniref:hypothetical protein n=1 Tax=Corynebacterium coyleae TaxID=53374 RepID=UPI00254B26F7|nr:hypothetical protein [Corynebacterium coyleae]MDK8241153.1 hypothetical protein [Corynebacterium coyleae]
MAQKLYPLAPSTWGAAVEIPVDHVSQAALFSDFAGKRGTSYVPVVLEANPLNASWRVRLHNAASQNSMLAGPVLGEVSPQWRSLFDEVERVHSSILKPVALAAVKLERDIGQFEVNLLLPEPQLAVPRNNAPETATVLRAGDMLVIDTTEGEFNAADLAHRSPGQWFVGLQALGDTAVATLDGKVLGSLAEPEVVEWVRSYEHGNLWARAILLDGMAALDAASPDEGTDTVPPLSAAPVRQITPWQVIDFPDGSWAITVERDAAIDPQDTVHPKHTARYVSLEGKGRPDELDAPTEMFARLDETETPDKPTAPAAPAKRPDATRVAQNDRPEGYLTEVEKVQLRRRNRKRRRGGRHRR